MHFDAEHCKDCATDMAFNFVDKLPYMQLSFDELLSNQIHQRKWDFLNNKGVRKLESKKEFKKHAVHLEGHSSPDRGDAAFLCLYNKNKVRLLPKVRGLIKAW
jgi:hypothetical protein